MANLRSYQFKSIRAINDAFKKGLMAVFLVLCTGAGKSTVMAAYVKLLTKKNKRVIFIVHRKELVKQFAERLLDQFGIDSGIIMAKFKSDYSKLVQVASIQSAIKRELPEADLIIVDEAHRIKAGSYEKVLVQYPDTRIIGLSATPFRADGKGFSDVFDILIHVIRIKEMISLGYLVGTKVYANEDKVDISEVSIKMGEYDKNELFDKYNDITSYYDVVNNYLKYGSGTKAVVFNINVEHSKTQNEAFLEAGIRSAHIDGTTPDTMRDDVMRRYASYGEDRIDVLNNVNIVTEGVDVPGIEVVILNKAIHSLAFYVQAIGRGLRPLLDDNYDPILNEDGTLRKSACLVLDHGENTLRHGFVEDYDEAGFSLEGRKKKKKNDEDDTTVKECNICHTIVPRFCKECPECGNNFKRERAELRLTDGTKMVLLDRDAVLIQRLRLMDSKKGKKLPLHLLRVFAELKGYQQMWWVYTAIDNENVNISADDPFKFRKIKMLLEMQEMNHSVAELAKKLGMYEIDQRSL